MAAIALMATLTGIADAASLRGTVRDRSGGAIPRAVVSILTARGSVVATVRADGDGNFLVPDLPEGTYVVRTEAPGFAGLQLAVTIAATSAGAASAVDITMDVAGVQEDVTVTASPGLAQDTARAIQAVSTMTREDLDRRISTVVAEAVTEEAGVHLQRTSPTMAGIVVRGLTGNKVNVFVDGVRYSNGAQRGGVNTFLDLIDPSVVDGIEVIRGPNSAQYGSDALGGSVQFLTRMPPLVTTGRRVSAEVSGSVQSAHAGGGANASLSFGTPHLGVFLTGGGRAVGDIRTGDGIDSHAAVTRFLGVPSNRLMPTRLPDTGFRQKAGIWSLQVGAEWRG